MALALPRLAVKGVIARCSRRRNVPRHTGWIDVAEPAGRCIALEEVVSLETELQRECRQLARLGSVAVRRCEGRPEPLLHL